MLHNNYLSKLLSLSIAVFLVAILILSVPFISGTIKDDDITPMLVVNSIDFSKKIIIKKQKIKKTPKKIPKKKLKSVKKPINKPKKIIKKPILKKKRMVPVEKNFSTKNKRVEKIAKNNDEQLPVPEPLYRVTEKPRLLRQGIKKYPEDMKQLGITATVIIDALIDRHGKVRKTTVFKSAGKSFNDAAIQAIKDSVFIPGKIAGKPVAVLFRLPIKFNLE